MITIIKYIVRDLAYFVLFAGLLASLVVASIRAMPGERYSEETQGQKVVTPPPKGPKVTGLEALIIIGNESSPYVRSSRNPILLI